MGSNPCREIQLLGIAHPIVGNNFRYRRYSGRGDTSKTLVMKRRPDLALFLYFINYGKKTQFFL